MPTPWSVPLLPSSVHLRPVGERVTVGATPAYLRHDGGVSQVVVLLPGGRSLAFAAHGVSDTALLALAGGVGRGSDGAVRLVPSGSLTAAAPRATGVR